MQVESSSLLELGKRESNTLVIYLEDENNPEKSGIILDKSGGTLSHSHLKLRRLERSLWPIS